MKNLQTFTLITLCTLASCLSLPDIPPTGTSSGLPVQRDLPEVGAHMGVMRPVQQQRRSPKEPLDFYDPSTDIAQTSDTSGASAASNLPRTTDDTVMHIDGDGWKYHHFHDTHGEDKEASENVALEDLWIKREDFKLPPVHGDVIFHPDSGSTGQ
ncbi:hypothetical protein AX17_005213 [Amanita inopinata Kibby_2008]|nr:hypothetical protein AX17_005213 [Amanita inopinata Kibby_2008]